ncbi:MAG: CoA-acylating methylmalonate-semialdehyde dehydrogenase [FCB group bacterium]|nr:CoA-acylating methylmalonate-semialdehyde dehydrogenase [FCB group bacterium]
MSLNRIPLYIDGSWITSQTEIWSPVYNPSTGEIIAEAPDCLPSEVNLAVEAAQRAFPAWAEIPAVKRVQYLFRLKQLLDENLHELATVLATENGKTHTEAVGSVSRGIEIVEFACGMPTLMMGESLENVSTDVDVNTWRQPLGVCAGICAFNFPAMIPMWMFPIAIAAGNTFVLKANSKCPNSAKFLMELLEKAELPKGVVNTVYCEQEGSATLVQHPDVKAVAFVGSTTVGKIVYETAARAGKRVQALCQAKNHALVLPDCAFIPTVKGIVNAAFGCAGERCMALPVIVVHEKIADKLAAAVAEYAAKVKVAPAEAEGAEMGPLVTPEHLQRVTGYIEKGVAEGAELLLDGRGYEVEGYPNGLYLGPTIFDHVTNEMAVGSEEIFGPVLSIKRVKSFEEGLQTINDSPYGNGAAIYTSSGYYARTFSRRVQAGMVGINVGIPVPLGFFSFTGWKQSFFGDLHSHGKDGVLFYTEKKSITYRWHEDPYVGDLDVGTWD